MAGAGESDIWEGPEQLAISIDLGTTATAVAFSHLTPGLAPSIRIVTRWPGQEDAAGDSKIPSIVAYKGTKAIACGAEAIEQDGNDGVYISRWFKLHLHPDSMKFTSEPPRYDDPNNIPPSLEIPPLPQGVGLKQVYSDFLKYLFNHTQKFFRDHVVDGPSILDRLLGKVSFCLATPNGWDDVQQAFLRDACVRGGLLPSNHELSRIRFVTEGEASVHYALKYSRSEVWLHQGIAFAVTDAGGSTVDSTLYRCTRLEPKLHLEEVRASECVQAGSVFVDRAARNIIQHKLGNSEFSHEEYLSEMMREFEKKTKRRFDGTQDASILKFGRERDTDRAHGINKGRLTLTKDEVKSSFRDVIPRIVQSCSTLISGRDVQYLLLVGGFGESPYLRKALTEEFTRQGVEVVTVDESTKKAAAEGAALWYIKNFVVARAARVTFGTIKNTRYDRNNPEHRRMEHLKFESMDGVTRLRDAFGVWVKKHQVIEENHSASFGYNRLYEKLADIPEEFTVRIYAYEGDGEIHWGRDERERLSPGVRRVCTLKADVSGLRRTLRPHRNNRGQEFVELRYRILVFFGGTSLSAKMTWNEGGQVREGPVTVIPDSIS